MLDFQHFNLLQHATSPVVAGTLWLLIVFSIITWTIIFVKAWQHWRLSLHNREFLRRFWQAKSLSIGEKIADTGSGSLAALCRAGFRVLTDLRDGLNTDLQHSGELRDILERTLRQDVQNQQSTLDAGLAPLASIGSTAPFVGLFGTVWGIMHALQDISLSKSAGLDVVAGPIGEALVATAIGIATAVPAVLAYNFFLRRLRINVAQLENFATDFLHLAIKNDLSREKGHHHGNSN